jgi:ACS family tartrate transporter-like MFS transporter
MDQTLERTTMRKVYLRMLPLAMIVYFFCYLDRINISFAALQMNASIGLTAAAYGLSSTAFYVGYCIFEVPSNVILDKVGARIWIARIMITWGIASGATAFVSGTTSFLVVRFLLGVAEAGLFPGIVLLFTYWFPDHHRARIVSSFTLALPISVAIGAPISTAILGMDGFLGYAGWKWIYIAEAIPTVLMMLRAVRHDRQAGQGAVALDGGKELACHHAGAGTPCGGGRREVQPLAGTGEPKDPAAVAELSRHRHCQPGRAAVRATDHQGTRRDQYGYRLCNDAGLYCGAISMMTWGWLSDRMGERRWNLFWACILASVGLVLTGLTIGSWWSLAGLCISTAGFYGTKGPFWSMPSMLLTGTAAAAGIAWINSVGNVGGAIGPALVGWIKDFTGSYSGGLYGLAAFTAVSALIAAFGLHIPRRIPLRASVGVPAE